MDLVKLEMSAVAEESSTLLKTFSALKGDSLSVRFLTLSGRS